MATPTATSYNVTSGATAYCGRSAIVPPTWLLSMSSGELASISGTAPSAASGLVPAVSGTMGTGGTERIVNAWCGAYRHNTKFCIHGGGHDDYGGNENGAIDLADNAPAWDLLNERTGVSALLGGSNYYADGKPTSRHTYYGMFVANVDGADKMLRFNSYMGFAFNGPPVGGSADVRTTSIDAFNLDTNLWEPGAYGPMPRSPGSESAMGQHPTTGDVYTWDTNGIVTMYDVSADTTSDLVDLPGTEGQGAAVVVDAVNGRLVRFAGRSTGGVVYWPLAGGSKTTPTLTGSGASALTAALSGSQHGWGRAHDTSRNHVYLYTTSSAIFRVNLANWSVDIVTPTGESLDTATNGWWGRVLYIPILDVVASLASWTNELQIYRI